jgi:integrase
MLPVGLDRVRRRARRAIGRPDLRYQDLRHSELTWAAASGASVAELMRRGGHASLATAFRYLHATGDRRRSGRRNGPRNMAVEQGKRLAAPTGFEPVSPP